MPHTTSSVWIKTQFQGFHKWSGAPDTVAYLRNLHRHVFGVRVEVSITDHNREIEFHMLKTFVDFYLRSKLMPFLKIETGLSCEMMAKMIGEELETQGFDVRSVEVNEDDECGGVVFFQQ